MLRYTLLSKVRNIDAIHEKYYVAMNCILDGTKVNWANFLIEELMWCKHEVRGSLGHQPYIMALVKSKAAFQGVEEIVHKSFLQPINDKDFFTKGLPQPQAPSAEGGESLARGGAHSHRRNADAAVQGWVPPAGYFEPFFEGIHA